MESCVSLRKFVVERNLPGAGNLSTEELQAISKTSCEVIHKLGKPYHWIQSFIAEDKIYCIHIAESEEVIREHARLGNFPVHKIMEIKTIIDPLTANDLQLYIATCKTPFDFMRLVRTLTRFLKRRRKNTSIYADAIAEAFKEMFEKMGYKE